MTITDTGPDYVPLRLKVKPLCHTEAIIENRHIKKVQICMVPERGIPVFDEKIAVFLSEAVTTRLVFILCFLPELFHLLQMLLVHREVLSLHGLLHMVEPLDKFVVCSLEGYRWFHLEMAADVDHGKQQVPQFFLQVFPFFSGSGIPVSFTGFPGFGQFFTDFIPDPRCIGPVKARPWRPSSGVCRPGPGEATPGIPDP